MQALHRRNSGRSLFQAGKFQVVKAFSRPGRQCWPISWCFMERLMLVGASRPSSCFNSKRSLDSTAFHSSSVCIAFSLS
jgi:hypothetical protein